MKPIDFGAVPPGLARQQNNTAPQIPEDIAPETQPGDAEGGVEVTLSPEAQELLNFQAGAFGPAHSTAAQARFVVTQTEGLEGLPFGKVVSALARGIDPSTLIAQPQDEEAPGADPLIVSVEEGEEETPAGEEILAAAPILETEDTPVVTSGAELALALLIQDGEPAI